MRAPCFGILQLNRRNIEVHLFSVNIINFILQVLVDRQLICLGLHMYSRVIVTDSCHEQNLHLPSTRCIMMLQGLRARYNFMKC